MKPETRAALIKQSIEGKQEIIGLLIDHMDPSEFVDALYDADGDPTEKGAAIIEELASDMKSPDDQRDEILNEMLSDMDALHSAICEGRKQDAIDILNSVWPEAALRSVKTQNFLFPERVQLDL